MFGHFENDVQLRIFLQTGDGNVFFVVSVAGIWVTLKFIVGPDDGSHNFFEIQRQFIYKMVWNKQNSYFVPSFSCDFMQNLFFVQMGSAEKNACFLHNCVLFKKKW